MGEWESLQSEGLLDELDTIFAQDLEGDHMGDIKEASLSSAMGMFLQNSLRFVVKRHVPTPKSSHVRTKLLMQTMQRSLAQWASSACFRESPSQGA